MFLSLSPSPEPMRTPVTARLVTLAGGRAGVAQTLRIMRQLARAAKVNIAVRMKALQIVAGLEPKDWRGEVAAVHAFVRDQIRYVRDIEGVETLQTPDKTLEFGQGDCDDKSTLLASLLLAIGHPVRFVAVGFKPRSFSHVLVETRIGEQWLPLETTVQCAPGFMPPGVQSRLILKV